MPWLPSRDEGALRYPLRAIDVLVEGIGDFDARQRTIGVWIKPKREKGTAAARFERGVVYYLRGGKVTGVVLWNASDLLERAREVIAEQPDVGSAAAARRLISIAPLDWLHVIETAAQTPGARSTGGAGGAGYTTVGYGLASSYLKCEARSAES